MNRAITAADADVTRQVLSDPLTIEMALGLPSLRRGVPRVVAGRRNLNRPIRWAHSSDVPNIATLLKGNELLLMTGMGVGATAAQQRRFVRALTDRHVAGVVIELGQVYRELPAAIVAEAEAHDLPVIELRREVRFVEVTEEIHSTIVSRQLALLTRGEELHQRLTGLMLDGADIPRILAALADTVANPVVLEKTGVGVLYHAAHHSGTPDVFAAWQLLGDGASRSLGSHGEAAIYPVLAAGHQIWGHLVALPLESPLDEFARQAVERTVTLVALELLRSREEALLVARERGDFLTDIATGRIGGDDAAATAQKLGFDYRRGSLLPLAASQAGPRRDGGARREAEWVPVLRAVRDELAARAIPALVGSAGSDGGAVVLLAISSASRRNDTVELCAAVIRSAAQRHFGSSELALIAAGPAVESWNELRTALRQTTETVELARAGPPRAWHDATVPDVGRLLHSLGDDTRLREFVAQRLEPVIAHDRSRAAKLMPTLDALAATGWHKAETARALHLNRQSLYPRLRRLELLLDASLDDPDIRLGIELALRARAVSP